MVKTSSTALAEIFLGVGGEKKLDGTNSFQKEKFWKSCEKLKAG